MRYLGIDFGLRRIGLAISEGSLASPWQVLEIKNFKDGFEKISKIINDEKFEKIIIGLPEGKMGLRPFGLALYVDSGRYSQAREPNLAIP